MFSCPPSITKTNIWRIGIQIFGGSDVVNTLTVARQSARKAAHWKFRPTYNYFDNFKISTGELICNWLQ